MDTLTWSTINIGDDTDWIINLQSTLNTVTENMIPMKFMQWILNGNLTQPKNLVIAGHHWLKV